jgi:hypothetical protein
VKKLLLASVLAIASTTVIAAEWTKQQTDEQSAENWGEPTKGKPWDVVCAERHLQDAEAAETSEQKADYERCMKYAPKPPARLTVAPPYSGPPPIGWVYGPYTQCANPPQCSMGVVNVQADGLNVRVAPDGYPVMSLVNGTPLIPLQKQGDWLLVAPACDLTPTWAWSWNAGVPLNRCWVYF